MGHLITKQNEEWELQRWNLNITFRKTENMCIDVDDISHLNCQKV